MTDIKKAINYFEYGIKCDIFQEPVTSYAKAAISALEKQIPRKVEILTYQPLINSGWKHRCPNCGCAVGKNKNLGFAYEEYLEPYEVYCSQCGQALDWSDTE